VSLIRSASRFTLSDLAGAMACAPSSRCFSQANPNHPAAAMKSLALGVLCSAFSAGVPSVRADHVYHNISAGMLNVAQIPGWGAAYLSRHRIVRHLAMKILEFMGADILVEVRRSPRWKVTS